MDTRSLIKFGRTSYAITLPQNWIKKEGLKKGSSLYLDENPNGLIVSSNSNATKRQIQKIDMDITGKDLPRIKRELISHYINGYDLVRIGGKELLNKSKAIREMVHDLAAFEVIEQTFSQVTARVLLQASVSSIPQFIRKIDIINRNMMQDLTADVVDYDDIFQRDEDVDRFTFLVLRVIKLNLNDTSYSRLTKINNADLLAYWNMAYLLEAIADGIRDLAIALKDVSKNKIAFADILKLYKGLVENYTEVMNSYYSKDINKAYKLSVARGDIHNYCDKLNNKYWNKKGVTIALERIKEVASLVHNICRRVFS